MCIYTHKYTRTEIIFIYWKHNKGVCEVDTKSKI